MYKVKGYFVTGTRYIEYFTTLKRAITFAKVILKTGHSTAMIEPATIQFRDAEGIYDKISEETAYQGTEEATSAAS